MKIFHKKGQKAKKNVGRRGSSRKICRNRKLNRRGEQHVSLVSILYIYYSNCSSFPLRPTLMKEGCELTGCLVYCLGRHGLRLGMPHCLGHVFGVSLRLGRHKFLGMRRTTRHTKNSPQLRRPNRAPQPYARRCRKNLLVAATGNWRFLSSLL